MAAESQVKFLSLDPDAIMAGNAPPPPDQKPSAGAETPVHYNMDPDAIMAGVSSPGVRAGAEPRTTLGGLAAAITRPAAAFATPALAGAGIGGMVGGPPGALVGAGLGGLGGMLWDTGAGIGNAIGYETTGRTPVPTVREGTDKVLDALGMTSGRDTPLEGAISGYTDAIGGAAGARAAGKLVAKSAVPAAKAVGDFFAKGTTKGMVGAGAVSATADQAAQAAGINDPALRLAISALPGVVVPGSPQWAALSGSLMKDKPLHTNEFVNKTGAILPPPMRTDDPSIQTHVMSHLARPALMNVEASLKNQHLANTTIAKELGLPDGTILTGETLKKAGNAQTEARRTLAMAAPFVLPDADFGATLASIKAENTPAGRVADAFVSDPELAKKITGVERILYKEKPDPTDKTKKINEAVPYASSKLLEEISILRRYANDKYSGNATQNDKNSARAARKVADALDDLIERNLSNAEGNWRARADRTKMEVTQADSVIAEAMKKEEAVRRVAAPYAGKSRDQWPSGVRKLVESAEETTFNAKERKHNLQQQALAEEASMRQAQAIAPQGKDLVTAYKAARQLQAKIHNVEKAVNITTGDINVAALSRQLNNGAPLTGALWDFASLGNAYEAAFQHAPSIRGTGKGGGQMDTYSGAAVIGHGLEGHVDARAGILGARGVVAKHMLGPYVQNPDTFPQALRYTLAPLGLSPSTTPLTDSLDDEDPNGP